MVQSMYEIEPVVMGFIRLVFALKKAFAGLDGPPEWYSLS